MLKQTFILFISLFFLLNSAHSNQTVTKEDIGETGNNMKNTETNMDTVTDYDGNQYATIKIGDQIWMAENLRSLHYSDGTKIEEVFTYKNDEKNASTYGRLYTWATVANEHKISPKGWRLPTDDYWKKLEKYLGMDEKDIEDTGWRDTESEAIRLKKEQEDFLWFNYSKRGVNSSGLSVIPAGVRSKSGSFKGMGGFADFWSSSEFDSDNAWNRSLTWSWLHPAKAKIYRKAIDKKWGFSVRCIKD